MNDRARTGLLLGLLLLIAAVVVVDSLRNKAKDNSDSVVTDVSALAQDVADQRALVEHETTWQGLLDERTAQWDGVLAKCVVASTPELAVADFRTLLVDTARSFNLEVDRTDRSASTPLEGVPSALDQRVHTIEVRLSVTSHDVKALYRFVDAVENFPDVVTHVHALTLDGPALAQQLESATATITVHALGVTPNTAGGDA